MRTRRPHPFGHSVHADCFISTGPRAGCGIHGQFWLQIEVSSSSFQGTGVTMRPAAAPALHTSRSRRVNFMLLPSFVAPKASGFNIAAAMTIFAVAHLHPFVRGAPQPRDGMPPDVAAVALGAIGHPIFPHGSCAGN